MKQIISGIQKTINTSYNQFGKIPFLFLLFAIVALYAWINGPALFPNWGENNTSLIMAYGFMVVIYLAWARKRTESELKKPISIAMFSFLTAFFLTWILLMCLVKAGVLVPATNFDHSLFWQVLIIQICVVATAEELMFRGVMLEVSHSNLFQATLFALWHVYAYQIMFYNLTWETFNWPALLIVFILGLILGIVARNKKWGIPACISVHSAYNLIIIGALLI